MAGIAPLSGSTSAPASSGTSDAPSNHAVSTPPKQVQSGAGSFTAFPSSYAGFGEDGSSFGTVSVVNGRLSVVSSAADTTQAPAAQNAPTPGEAQASNAPQPKQPDAVPVSGTHAAAPPQPAPAPVVTAAAKDDAGEAPIPSAKPAAAQPPGIPDGQPQSDPTQGLLGSGSAQTSPGAPQASTTPSVSPLQGLLGAPPTNPIVIQAENQQRAAAANAAEEENAAAAQTQADHVALQQINERIAAARAAGNAAAVAQLEPKQTAVLGDLQDQAFAGLGSSPPRPFARPEIPTVFLNIAS